MSGGSYDYVAFKMTEAAETLRWRHYDQPHLLALATLMERIANVMHDVEWADSGDTSWTPELHAAIRAVLAPGVELDVAIAMAKDSLTTLRNAVDNAVTERAKARERS